MNDLMNKLATWPFMNEPIWRWFVFMVAMGGIMTAWNGVLAFMK